MPGNNHGAEAALLQRLLEARRRRYPPKGFAVMPISMYARVEGDGDVLGLKLDGEYLTLSDLRAAGVRFRVDPQEGSTSVATYGYEELGKCGWAPLGWRPAEVLPLRKIWAPLAHAMVEGRWPCDMVPVLNRNSQWLHRGCAVPGRMLLDAYMAAFADAAMSPF